MASKGRRPKKLTFLVDMSVKLLLELGSLHPQLEVINTLHIYYNTAIYLYLVIFST